MKSASFLLLLNMATYVNAAKTSLIAGLWFLIYLFNDSVITQIDFAEDRRFICGFKVCSCKKSDETQIDFAEDRRFICGFKVCSCKKSDGTQMDFAEDRRFICGFKVCL